MSLVLLLWSFPFIASALCFRPQPPSTFHKNLLRRTQWDPRRFFGDYELSSLVTDAFVKPAGYDSPEVYIVRTDTLADGKGGFVVTDSPDRAVSDEGTVEGSLHTIVNAAA